MASWSFDCNTAPADGPVWVVSSSFGSPPEWASDGASIVADPAFQSAWALRIDTPASGNDQEMILQIPAGQSGSELEATVLSTSTHVDHGGYSWLFVSNTIQRYRDGVFQSDTPETLPNVAFEIHCTSVAGTQKVFIDDVEVDSWTDGTPLTNGGTRSYQEVGSKGGRIANIVAGDIGTPSTIQLRSPVMSGMRLA